jgi:hypothetical protein
MADRHQLRSGFGCRSADDAAELSPDGAVVVDGVCDIDELLLSLGMVVLGVVVLGAVVLGAVVLGVVADGVVVVLALGVDCA